MKFQHVQPGQISLYDYMGKSIFIPARRDSFLPGLYLDLYTCLFFCIKVKHCPANFSHVVAAIKCMKNL